MAIAGNGVTTPDPLSERLMALPMIPRHRVAGDGTEPTGSGAGAAPAQKPASPAPNPDAPPSAQGTEAPSTPTLEDAADALVFRTIDQLVRGQDRLARNRWAIDTHFKRVDGNVPFSRLEKLPNQSAWVAKLPPGASKETPAAVPNKAADLNNKVTDALLADPPKPNPQAHVDSEAAEQAGDLASEFLRLDGGEAGTNDVQQYRWGLRNGLTCGSSFLHYREDRDGGGYQPYQVLAHPKATDAASPLEALIPDPATGQTIVQHAVDPILRYVSAPTPESPAGVFVEQASDADRVWLPAIAIDQLRREQVRTFPATAPIEKADAVILLLWCTLAEARARWDTVAEMNPEQLAALASWRPANAEMVVPYTFRGGMADGMTGPALNDVGSFSPILQRRMYYYRMYVAPSREYANGLQVDVSGANGGSILDRETLEYTVTMPQGETLTRCREIPVVQITPNQDVLDGDPMGWPFIARFAGSSEATATLYAAYLDALDQRLHPHVFIRSTTAVDEDDWADRSTPIMLNPADNEPTYEVFPPLPDIVAVAENLHQQQDTASGLTATAQGLDTSSSVSGIAKQLTVRQAQVSLAGIQQQLQAAFTRGWRIKCQMVQAYFSTARKLHYSGEDGSAQVRWFSAADMAGIDDVGIEPGTGTMMTAESKANYVAFLQGQQWLTPDRAAEVGMAGISRDLGLPPDPVEQAIERAVLAWLDGPDPQWLQQIQSAEQQTAQLMQEWQRLAQTAQVTGQQPPPQPVAPPMPPPPTNPFPPRPNDTEPLIATKWVTRLSKLMMSPQYSAQPKEWTALVDQRYLAARQVITPPMQLPKGVTITAKGDATTIAQEEQAAVQGVTPGAQIPTAPQRAAPAHGVAA